ncbi:hypothetical protein [Bacillus sp. TL12]|uniref:hypothetical protein n=1 Tax=Bacillus sp. TL12 TaxID=2894756 RepID=UPI001F526F90|nr:hypothetical protein [Bacillus sp. TL12]MCI0768313.1 hypothetical protein [Bacillus sp. TL12]
MEVLSTLDDLTILTFFVTPQIANDNRIKTNEESKNNLLLVIYEDSAHFLHLAGYSLIVVVLLFEYK